MKIGILTFHNAYNYGAVLQAFALQTYLENQGHQVEIIDYRNDEVELSYTLFRFRSIPKRNIVNTIKYLVNHSYRSYKYPEFHKNAMQLLKLSPRVNSLKDSSIADKDVIIIGSDQLWNRKITRILDPFYWGEFAGNIKGRVITYAICMNTDTLSSEQLDYMRNHLGNFDSLSVRETDLANVLRSLTSKPVHISLDPTLMVDACMWREMIKKEPSPTKEPYVLVYAILERKKVIEEARKFAEKRGLKLVIMSPIADVRPLKGYYQPNSPLGFISAIAQAEYVVTSSFHGLAFSVIFHRKVYVMGDSGKNERMHSLLDNLGIGDRFVDNMRDMGKGEINYSSVEYRLNLLRSQSRDYLNTAIKG